MIELKNNNLEFSFPDVHKSARLNISFMRTLRVPDDGNTYPLPPGFDTFPMRHVDDFAKKMQVNEEKPHLQPPEQQRKIYLQSKPANKSFSL